MARDPRGSWRWASLRSPSAPPFVKAEYRRTRMPARSREGNLADDGIASMGIERERHHNRGPVAGGAGALDRAADLLGEGGDERPSLAGARRGGRPAPVIGHLEAAALPRLIDRQ